MIANSIEQFGNLGMPASRRDRIASLRVLPWYSASVVPGQKCVLGAETTTPVDLAGVGSDHRSVVTQVADSKGAFPGASAWSPPT